MKVSIIIPSLRDDALADLIKSIKRNTKNVEYEIIVRKDPGGTVIPTNKGFDESQGEYVCTIPDDCVVCEGWLEKAIEFMEKKEGVVIGDFEMQRDRTEGEPKLMQPVQYFGKTTAVFPILKKRTAEQLGGFFRGEYQCFYADIDLSLRAWAVGGKVLTIPGARIHVKNRVDGLSKCNVKDFALKDEEVFNKYWRNLG